MEQPCTLRALRAYRGNGLTLNVLGGGGIPPPAGFCSITQKWMFWLFVLFSFTPFGKVLSQLDFWLLSGVGTNFPTFSIHFNQKQKNGYLLFGLWWGLYLQDLFMVLWETSPPDILKFRACDVIFCTWQVFPYIYKKYTMTSSQKMMASAKYWTKNHFLLFS